MHAGQVAVSQDVGVGVLGLQSFEEGEQGPFLFWRPCVGWCAVLVQSTLVAHPQRALVIAPGVSPYELLVACLIHRAVAGDVVVIARESEAVGVTADECCHREVLVAAGGTAVDDD